MGFYGRAAPVGVCGPIFFNIVYICCDNVTHDSKMHYYIPAPVVRPQRFCGECSTCDRKETHYSSSSIFLPAAEAKQ